MDWTCSNLPDSLEKFERHSCLMFDRLLKGKSKKELSAYVLLWIGDKGHMIHASWDLTDDENRDPSTIFKRFRDFVQPKSNPVFARYKFYHETQGNDSIEEFVTRLTISARDCDFGDHADEMIRDRIVFGCRSERVREKLTEKGRDLNLDLAKQISQAHKYNRQQMEAMKESGEVDWVSNRNRCQMDHRNHSARRKQRMHTEGLSKRDNPPNCTRCGRKSHGDKTGCPALGKQCGKCGKKNHFSKLCRTNTGNNQNVHVINEDLSCASSDGEDFCVLTVSGFSNSRSDQPFVKLKMYNKYIDAKIDTGSQVNILPSKLFEQLNVSAPLSAAYIRLTSYSGDQLRVLGKLKIHCAYKNRYANANFYIVDQRNLPALLNLETA